MISSLEITAIKNRNEFPSDRRVSTSFQSKIGIRFNGGTTKMVNGINGPIYNFCLLKFKFRFLICPFLEI